MKIEDINKDNIGDGVIYRTAPDFEPQAGTITSFNDTNIFVAFGNRTMGRGEACCPSDLELIYGCNK